MIFIFAPTILDAKNIKERHVKTDARVLLFSSNDPEKLRGPTITSDDIIIANDEHLSKYASEEFWTNLQFCMRGSKPTLIDVS